MPQVRRTDLDQQFEALLQQRLIVDGIPLHEPVQHERLISAVAGVGGLQERVICDSLLEETIPRFALALG